MYDVIRVRVSGSISYCCNKNVCFKKPRTLSYTVHHLWTAPSYNIKEVISYQFKIQLKIL